MEDEEKIIEQIGQMTQTEMARLWRFAPSGHLFFDKSKPFFKIFKKRFDKLGGFISEISKEIDNEIRK
jgi:hypothetical protein